MVKYLWVQSLVPKWEKKKSSCMKIIVMWKVLEGKRVSDKFMNKMIIGEPVSQGEQDALVNWHGGV